MMGNRACIFQRGANITALRSNRIDLAGSDWPRWETILIYTLYVANDPINLIDPFRERRNEQDSFPERPRNIFMME